ncbi:hypothetical protein Goari_005935 [Gossypium aridum]|uniref:O-methyltransferase C-terminal domain-containing protein n=1 Tax=Gossypium aridum TaxID=34290 RepID=A0A7J8XM28_GOSAI|nr:hypothetical protein [Gossypium aridum]
MATLILLEISPVMLAPWHSLSSRVLDSGNSPFEIANGKDAWSYAEKNPGHSKFIDEAMACEARVAVQAIIEEYPQVFDGIKSLVDFGGSNGTVLAMLGKAFPWIHGIHFDLPFVVAVAAKVDGVENIGGDMFECVQRRALECIKILKKCREAIPEDKGEAIIVQAVVEVDKNRAARFREVDIRHGDDGTY